MWNAAKTEVSPFWFTITNAAALPTAITDERRSSKAVEFYHIFNVSYMCIPGSIKMEMVAILLMC